MVSDQNVTQANVDTAADTCTGILEKFIRGFNEPRHRDALSLRPGGLDIDKKLAPPQVMVRQVD